MPPARRTARPTSASPSPRRAPVAGLLRAPAPGERPLGGARVEAGAAVGDPQHGVPLVDPAPERDPARRGRGAGGVDRVVDEVADDRDEVAGVGEPVGDAAVGREAQVDALLTRLGHLRDDERGQLGHPDRGQHGVGEVLGEVSSAVANSSASSARPSSISETTVCSWLAASWAWALRESANPRTVVQLADERPQLGVVAQGDDRAEPTAVPARRLLLTTTMRSAVRWISSERTSPEASASPSAHGQPQRVDGHADGLVGQVEQPPGLVVDELHARPRGRAAPSPRGRRAARRRSTRCAGRARRARGRGWCAAASGLTRNEPPAASASATATARQHGEDLRGERAAHRLDRAADRHQRDHPAVPSRTGTTARTEGPSVPV